MASIEYKYSIEHRGTHSSRSRRGNLVFEQFPLVSLLTVVLNLHKRPKSNQGIIVIFIIIVITRIGPSAVISEGSAAIARAGWGGEESEASRART